MRQAGILSEKSRDFRGRKSEREWGYLNDLIKHTIDMFKHTMKFLFIGLIIVLFCGCAVVPYQEPYGGRVYISPMYIPPPVYIMPPHFHHFRR